jgi:hypothetical protein
VANEVWGGITMAAQMDNLSFDRPLSVFHRLNGVFLVIGALGVGGIGAFALDQIATALRENPEYADNISPLALKLVDNRWLLLILVIPVIVAGSALIFSSRRGGWRWLTFIAGMLWIFILFAGILFAFIRFVAPLYQYQPM